MIIAITDKIANYIKPIIINTIINIIKLIAALLMIITMTKPNIITFLLSIILYVWLDKKGSIFISYVCMILVPIMVYYCLR